MAAFNWINVDAPCPGCGQLSRIRCQTHVASGYSGDGSGRFHDREYELGEQMAWWPRDHDEFDGWRANRMQAAPEGSSFDEEACYASCQSCGAALFAVVRFHEVTPEQVLAIGAEANWPDGYLK